MTDLFSMVFGLFAVFVIVEYPSSLIRFGTLLFVVITAIGLWVWLMLSSLAGWLVDLAAQVIEDDEENKP